MPLFPFILPSTTPAPAVLILPGGGYHHLAGNYEGGDLARFFNSHGIAAFVLHYRVAPHRHPAPLEDAAAAMRTLRANAADYRIDPARIAVLGFSAGGHLAATLSNLHHTVSGEHPHVSARPDAAILCYPVITFGEYRHDGSLRNLLGSDPDPALRDQLSMENAVTPDTPPTFLWHTVEDPAVPVENALLYAAACRRHNVPFALHIFPKGRHGLGMAPDLPARAWLPLAIDFLKERGF